MRAAWVLVVALAGCEDTSRDRDRPRLQPKNRVDRTAVADADLSSILVVVAADGRVTVDGRVVPDVELERTFREVFLRKSDTYVRLVPDPDADYKRIIQVMDLAQTAGLTSIGLEAP